MQWILDRARAFLLIWACLLMFGFGFELGTAYADSCSDICATYCSTHGGCAASAVNGGTCSLGCADGETLEVPAV